MSASDWIIDPSNNRGFVATMVVASLLVASFFVGTGVMLHFWVKSWRGDDRRGKDVSGGKKEIDLEAGYGQDMPGPSMEGSDESPIVESIEAASKWHHETVTIDAGSSASESPSTRTSSDVSSNDLTQARPQSQDLHESNPSQ